MPSRPRIDRWSCQLRPDRVLVGIVSGHPLLPDGPIQTSHVARLDVTGRRLWTLNTYYDLGDPDPEWVRWLFERGWTPERFTFPPSPPGDMLSAAVVILGAVVLGLQARSGRRREEARSP